MYQLLPIDPLTGQERELVKCLTTGRFIPTRPGNTNRRYKEYLAWLAEGNEPLPADDPS
jgi:hypothetical protein